METAELSFEATPQKGCVSARLSVPDHCRAVAILAHGAGADMLHRHLEAIANALTEIQIATFRFNFPYMEARRRRTDTKPVCLETIGNAIACAKANGAAAWPMVLAGHSFGGRMCSHYAAETGAIDPEIKGLIYFSFPLHPADKPNTNRANHMSGIVLPQLFLSGTRDKMAELPLLHDTVAGLPNATLHEIDTADHSFTILKRTRTSTEDVYDECGRVISEWLAGI